MGTLQSCKDHDHDDDHGELKVSIVSPAEGTVHNESDTLWIKVNMSVENDDLHDYSIVINNLTNNTTMYTYNGHSHSSTLNTNLWVLPVVEANSNMQLIVKNMDHDGNTKETSVKFTINNNVASAPEITITKPTGNEDLANGAMVDIEGLFKSNTALKSAKVVITKEGDTAPKFSYDIPVSGLTQYQLDTTWKIDTGGQMHNDFVFTFTATDNNDKSSTKTVNLHVH
ncbi:MAG: hypothetical protein EAY81_02180 [Bacteroidetes bacterium]|nr:MAG: hypothetical protein EAY81_02180 [Bacteroidota bacterium]